jgi:NAD(P)-dependent dehydrogenase (short-subunit alcohol dehydrogenase family)
MAAAAAATTTPFSMSGRRCLVTGATDPQSIGYACAQALLAAGAAHVVVMGRDQAKVEAAVAGLKGEGACVPCAVVVVLYV